MATSASAAVRVLSIAALAGALAVGGRAQDGGAHPAGGTCLECHDDVQAQTGRRVHHEPAAAGRCTDCHSPHAARFDHLLNLRERALCFSCHETQKLSYQTGSVHTPVKQGRCTACHEVHGSEHESLLVTTGNGLCFTCHVERQEQAGWTTVHAPFAVGECSDCHAPHNSPHESQLVEASEQLCVMCHDVAEAAVTEGHHGIPVEGTRCSDCHDPHASRDAELLRPYTHAPFAFGECDACHLVDSGTPRLVAALGARLCSECHDEVPDPTEPVVHGPVADGQCAACHSPHASRHPKLLVDEQQRTCLQCHGELEQRAATSRTSHPVGAEDGACLACHEPHSSKEEWLLTSGSIRTCLACHETQRHGHPLGADRIDPRTGKGITCVTCHAPHGTAFPYMLRGDQSRGLCLECHSAAGGQPGEPVRR